MNSEINIRARDYWVKVVDMLQQNWALVEILNDNQVKVFFLGDTSGVFDEMYFDSKHDAYDGLRRNGFKLYSEEIDYQKFMSPPKPPYFWKDHPNGKIYSSSQFWRSR